MTHTAKHTTHWITRQGFRCTDIVDSVTKEDIGYFKDHDQALKAAAAPAMYEALREIVAAVGSGEVIDYSSAGDWYTEACAALAQAEGGGHE